MKRYGYLIEKIANIDNIKLAHKNARKGKAFYDEVKKVDMDIDGCAEEIHNMLSKGTFTTAQYRVESKMDKGKLREIYKLPYFPDRIIHHAIMQILEPIWKPTLIVRTYQSIKGRGPHKALSKLKNDILKNGNMYYLKTDIRKYYPSIDNEILKEIVRKTIKCPGTLKLLDDIIGSCDGVPIGNYISQYFGNLYLNELDHKLTSAKVKYYRYCDDIVILSTSKDELWTCKNLLDTYIKLYKLKLKFYRVGRITEKSGLDYLGYIIYTNRTLLRKRIKYSAINNASIHNVHSYIGWAKHCNGHNLIKKLKRTLNDSTNK